MKGEIVETNGIHELTSNTQNIISFNGDDHVKPLPQFTACPKP
jgi:hypothetical protein